MRAPLISAFFLVMATVFPTITQANDASYYGRGSAVFAYKENRVQMVSEKIMIRHAPDKKHPNTEWAADCTFVFENLSDEPVTIQMGFPDSDAFPPIGPVGAIRAFETTIKGARIPSTRKTVNPIRRHLRLGERDHAIPPVTPADPETIAWREMAKTAIKTMDLGFSAAYTWPVSFAPRERIVVKNSYRFGGGGTNGPIDLCLQNLTLPEGAFWYKDPLATGFGSGPCSEASYVVTTGKTWVPPIKDALIEFEIPPGTAPNHIIPVPPATEVTAKVVRWHYKDFRPTQELKVVFAYSMSFGDEDTGDYLDFSSPEQVKEWLRFGKANGFTRELIGHMRDIQAYSFGLRETGQTPPKAFNEWRKPKVKDARSLAEFTSAERQIIALLTEASSAPSLPVESICPAKSDALESWPACVGQRVRLTGPVAKQIWSHPIAGHGLRGVKQTYLDILGVQLVVASPDSPTCTGKLVVTGTLNRVKLGGAPGTKGSYAGWSVTDATLICKETGSAP